MQYSDPESAPRPVKVLFENLVKNPELLDALAKGETLQAVYLGDDTGILSVVIATSLDGEIAVNLVVYLQRTAWRKF